MSNGAWGSLKVLHKYPLLSKLSETYSILGTEIPHIRWVASVKPVFGNNVFKIIHVKMHHDLYIVNISKEVKLV